MWAAGARRFLLLFGLVSGLTVLASLALGALTGASLRRSLAVGFYLAGSFLVLAGFFMGSKGVLRAETREDRSSRLLPPRHIRTATAAEQRETLAASALVGALGLALVAVGVAADSEHDLV